MELQPGQFRLKSTIQPNDRSHWSQDEFKGESDSLPHQSRGSNWICWFKRGRQSHMLRSQQSHFIKVCSECFQQYGSSLQLRHSEGYYEMLRNLVKFAETRGMVDSSEILMTAFHAAGKKLQCGKKGHRAQDCHSRETRACFNYGQRGHLATCCRKVQQRSSSGGCGSGLSSNNFSAVFVSFGVFRAGRCCKGSIELINDSGCKSFMLKNMEFFCELDEDFLADVCNANSNRSEFRGCKTARCS